MNEGGILRETKTPRYRNFPGPLLSLPTRLSYHASSFVPATMQRASSVKEAAILLGKGTKPIVEQTGIESIQLSADGGFVRVRVPVRLIEEAPKGPLTYRYQIGSFLGREASLVPRAGGDAQLAIRIPKELFRPRERLSLAVMARSKDHTEKILWSKRYHASWRGELPQLEPVDELEEPPGGTP